MSERTIRISLSARNRADWRRRLHVDYLERRADRERSSSQGLLPTLWYSAVIMVPIEDVCDDEWAEWYRLTPQERWAHSQALWPAFLALGGTLDPEPDTHSPFFDADTWRPMPADGRAGVRVLRRGRI